MTYEKVQNRRIREIAPHRKSMSMSDEDLKRASDLETMFNILYPDERPFTFSKTMSKALEIAFKSFENKEPVGASLSGGISARSPEPSVKPVEKSRVPKMFRNGKKH